MDRPHARLMNGDGELVAEGPCHVDEQARRATLEVAREPGEILKERGYLALELETGRSLAVSDSPMVFRLSSAMVRYGRNDRGRVYRFRLIQDGTTEAAELAQDAEAAGGVSDGALALPERETPAAR